MKKLNKLTSRTLFVFKTPLKVYENKKTDPTTETIATTRTGEVTFNGRN